jgi:micrococcal nuclease
MTPQALASVGAVNITGTVTTVIDGDTIELNGRTVRLSGINAPELTFGKKEAGALEAKQYLESLVLGKQVMLDVDNLSQTDKYNRTLARIYLDGMDVNREMLTQGYAKPLYIKPSEFPPYSVNITVSVDDHGNLLAVTNKSALNSATSHITTWRNQ